jgi:hypothetical protein
VNLILDVAWWRVRIVPVTVTRPPLRHRIARTRRRGISENLPFVDAVMQSLKSG